jgi:hypothetical protein
MFVVRKPDMEADAVSVRVHGKDNLGAELRAGAIADFLRTVAARSAWLTGRLCFTIFLYISFPRK